nr:MAG TPA: hypothetical protein [Caudoviricetes sp.]
MSSWQREECTGDRGRRKSSGTLGKRMQSRGCFTYREQPIQLTAVLKAVAKHTASESKLSEALLRIRELGFSSCVALILSKLLAPACRNTR